MAYKQNAGRENLRSSAIDLITDYEKKKPKVSKETKVEKNATVDGVTGTLKTLTTTTNTPGTTGAEKPGKPTGPTEPFRNPALPNQTYQEFIDAPPGSPGKPAKPTKTPDTPGRTSVDVKTRFTPNATKLESSGPSFSKPELKADLSNVQSLSNKPKIPQYYHHTGSNAHNMKFGGHTTTSNTTNPNGNFSASYTQSPNNTISGRSNTTSSVPFTQAQNMAVHAGYRIGQNPPPSDKVANAFVTKKMEKVQKRALAKYNKMYNK